MLQKFPKRSPVGFFIRGFFALEILCFSASYYVYHRMNTSRDYRRWMYDKNYTILDGFYRLGERFGDNMTRRNDFQIWGIKDKNE